MKLVLDQTACQGYGLCQQAAPDLIDLDDWGYAGLRDRGGAVPAGAEPQAAAAAGACPVQALRAGQ